MDNALQKELKKVLTGRVILREEGVLTALPDGQFLVFHGAPDGWESARFRKIIKRERVFVVAEDADASFQLVFETMQKLGRLLYLESDPDALACIRRYVTTKPVVISANYEEDNTVHVAAYTGKSLFAGFACRRGLRDFKRALPVREEVSKAETPKREKPKVETPKREKPKAEAPKRETPKAEKPKREAPKAEPPKREKPKTEKPKREAPKAKKTGRKKGKREL